MTSIVPRHTLREMLTLRDAVDQMIEGPSYGRRRFRHMNQVTNMLPLDVYETEDQLVVKVAVPGVQPEDISVTVTGDLLTIKAETKAEETEEQRKYLRQERRYGSCCRQLTLPEDVDTDNVEAVFEHGVLSLTLAKAETAKSKTVKVVTK